MELPFAVNEESSNFPPSSSNSNSNNNSNNNNNNNARNSSNSSLLPTTTASPNSYQNVNVNVNNNNMNMIGNSHSYPVPVPVGVNANANGSTNPTRSGSTSSSLSSAGGNLLHRVALYDNVHTEHFYTPRQLSSTSSLTSTGSNTSAGSPRLTPIHDNTATANNNNHNNRSNNNNSMAESTFVTIDVDHNNNYNNVNYNNTTTHNNNNNSHNNSNNNSHNSHNNSHVNNNNHQMLHYNEYSTIQSSNQQNYTNAGTGGLGDQSYVSVGLNSYKQKQQELQQLQKLQQQGQGQHQQHQLSSSPKQEKFDILSLLISSCSDPPHHQQQHHHHEPKLSEDENKTDDVHDITNDLSSSTTITPSSTNTTTTKTTNFVQLCEEASKAASKASKLTHDGDITNATIQHQNSAKLYKDAAIYLKKNHGVELALLAYSLLVLSNSQSRTCEALLKNGGISGVSSMGGTVENGKGSCKGTNKNYMVSTGNVNDQKSKGSGALMTEQRLRDKIRASMNKAEVDMSDSTFLSKDSSTTISNGNGTSDPHSNGNALSHKLNNTVQGSQQHSANNEVIISAGGNTVNPVDDMMELEKELRDMDMTLEMGVGLGNNNNNNNNGGGSFCVVPGGSSYMASSMMWSSGIGGRAQQPPSQQQHPLHGTNTIVPQHNAKTRMNRVQTMLDASSATLNKPAAPGISQYHNTIIAPAPKQTPSSLEASWWGQASALASSTTSLSNSMVGVRSPNSLTPHQMNGMDNASAAPANTRQLMKLLDSLKTLGDENASLLREVEEAQKARLEAKAAREAMKQFQNEYGKRFESLRLALEKFRNDYPERHGDNAKSGGGSNNQNVVAKSDFVKTNMMMENKKAKIEIQKKDQMIKMLTADLKKEKAESKKKDDKLRKFENFYRDVKARSAQKAKQREEEQRRKNQINRKG